ncbi:MAG: quorum-sensing autoinducer CAI-1 synthase [Legionellales bacterium]|nr:quorum-sensing autoinducer CAI-1 synthase [Legionellales bacterium]
MNKITIPVDKLHAITTEPEFLRKRVINYYQNRIPKPEEGGHPLIGKCRIPQVNAVTLCSCDYLSIANHPKIVQAHAESLLTQGNGLVMSSVFQSDESPQRKFEVKMAEFLGCEDVLLCQSGWIANTGLIQSIADRDTPVYVDMMGHMSLREGITSANATAYTFRHNNPESLEYLIQRHGKGVILVESLYSTHGDIAPLNDFAEISERYGCILVVDESHSLGTHGVNGEGLVAELGLLDKVQFRTASLGKAFCGRGGVIAGSSRHIEYIRFESRPTIFSIAVLPHEADAFSATIDVVKEESWRRTRCQQNARYLRNHLLNLGYNVSESQSQIMALEAGLIKHTNLLNDLLQKQGVYGSVFWEPATAKNRSLLRLSIAAELSEDQLNHVVTACFAIRDHVYLSEWSSSKRWERTRHQVAPIPRETLKLDNLPTANALLA